MISGEEFLEHELTDWRYLSRSIHARFGTDNFVGSMQLAAAVTVAAEEMNHHPDLDVRWGRLEVVLSSHDVGGVTDRDLDLARTISELAQAQGCESRPDELTMLELGLDTPDYAAIKPFWAALLGMTTDQFTDDAIYDKSGRLPSLWFQECDPDSTARQRFHPDLFVPPDQAEARVAAAIAAGGRLVTAENAPSFWVLADAQGNHACVCTSLEAVG